MHRWSLVLVPALLATLASPVRAQFGPGGGGMRPGAPGGQPTTQPGEEKEEGPAEAAPEEKGTENPALQPLPAWPQAKEKSLQFFQLNGYIRFRAYLFHNLNMGYYTGMSGPVSPFFIPLSEINSNGMVNSASNPLSSCTKRNGVNCRDDNSTSADMRLRLEPTINVTAQVRVHAQIDVFDNMVLGSTPEGYTLNGNRSDGVQINAFARTQVAPIAGYNSPVGSIAAKRAWAEVQTPFGMLKFGRMPSHWGMGMLVHNGDCLDCDYGTNADRVMFSTKLWGHFFAFLWDWVATGPTTQIIGSPQAQGPVYNADTIDDVSQWILALGKQYKPEELKETVDQGKMALQYGGYFVYRQQTWDETTNPKQATGNDPSQLQTALNARNAKAFIPDIWLRLDWKKLHIEAEGAMIVGTIGNLTDRFPGVKGATSILSGGFTVKADYKLLHDALKIFMEVGYASGDDSEDPNASLNARNQTLLPINNRINRFFFDPDYHVDLILFRRILGTVNNATYFKPGVSYDIVDNFGARLDILYALANRPVGYPGNSFNLGLEIDAALEYRNEEDGFYASLRYGVLFPFGALNFPAEIYGTQFAHNADTAQTFQARLAVKF